MFYAHASAHTVPSAIGLTMSHETPVKLLLNLKGLSEYCSVPTSTTVHTGRFFLKSCKFRVEISIIYVYSRTLFNRLDVYWLPLKVGCVIIMFCFFFSPGRDVQPYQSEQFFSVCHEP